jgi:ribonuclease P protein component
LSDAEQPSRSLAPASTADGNPFENSDQIKNCGLPKNCDLLENCDLRLRKHADYQRVYKATRKQFSSSMSWFLAPRSTPIEISGPRVGLTAGKVLGKAHERNRIKRRMREAVRHAIHELPEGVDLILHPKRSVMTMDFVKLEAEVLRIFRQAATQTREATSRAAQGKPVLGPEPARKQVAIPSPGQSVQPMRESVNKLNNLNKS